MVGKSTDGEGIVGEIEKVCRLEPSLMLIYCRYVRV
jgi:hypothetical protein